ncbi:hypothetical protein ACOSQ2_020843 [Xanthoceras sorbifolium]
MKQRVVKRCNTAMAESEREVKKIDDDTLLGYWKTKSSNCWLYSYLLSFFFFFFSFLFCLLLDGLLCNEVIFCLSSRLRLKQWKLRVVHLWRRTWNGSIHQIASELHCYIFLSFSSFFFFFFFFLLFGLL